MKNFYLAISMAFSGLFVAQNASKADVPINEPPRTVDVYHVDKPTSTYGDFLNKSYRLSANPQVHTQTPYDNYVSSQSFESSFSTYDSEVAEDFTVPAGINWKISEIMPLGVIGSTVFPSAYNVVIYQDNAGVPGTAISTFTGLVPAMPSQHPLLSLPTEVTLSPGKYWISVQADMDFSAGGQWYWQSYDGTETVGSPAVWRNPGGGFVSCTSWAVISTCAGFSAEGSDNLSFVLYGATAPLACQTFTGMITTGDPTVVSRIFRDAIASECSTPKVFPGVATNAGPFRYKTYTFTNTSASAECATIEINNADASYVHLIAYSGSFDPSNIATNYLGDVGSSSGNGAPTSMGVVVPAGGTVVLVAMEAGAASAFTSEYTISLTGTNCGVFLRTGEVGGKKMSIYPNPTSGVLYVNGINATSSAIFDMSGKKINTKMNNNEVDTQSLPKGNYILQLEDKEGNVHNAKFIKK